MGDGIERTSYPNWKKIERFIDSEMWWIDDPILHEDAVDPLLEKKIPFGAFMLGFDFHLTSTGPKLIEINTNAGGLATVFTFSCTPEGSPLKEMERKHITNKFIKAIRDEYNIGYKYFHSNYDNSLSNTLTTIAIVDDNVEKQGLYSEMLEFKRILEEDNLNAFVVSPEDLHLKDNCLYYNDYRIDFLYNRITPDFRLRDISHQHIRQAGLAGEVVISPHPATYVRVADKRNLPIISDKILNSTIEMDEYSFKDIIPLTLSMNEKSMDEWIKERKKWVFKPPEGNGSKGVYRGDKISATKLKSLPMESTLAQEYCPPSTSEDGTKLDFRVFTRDNDVLGLATRHFTGQVMEMKGKKSGFKMALPDSVCCFAVLKGSSTPFCNPSCSNCGPNCECGK